MVLIIHPYSSSATQQEGTFVTVEMVQDQGQIKYYGHCIAADSTLFEGKSLGSKSSMLLTKPHL